MKGLATFRDLPILSLMVAQTVIWAAIFYIFPALVLEWQAEFGWRSTQTMGALSLALCLQGIIAPSVGRILDRGGAPLSFPLGATAAAVGLVALAFVESLWMFYIVWGWLGVAMGFTLYDACFSVVTRARGAAARQAITAITLVAGFASTLSFPMATALSAFGGWRLAVLVFAALVLFVNLPLTLFAARRLEGEARAREGGATTRPDAASVKRPSARSGYWPLAMGFALAALGIGMLRSHLLPLLESLGITSPLAVLTASLIGPAQVASRVILVLAGARVAAIRLAQVAFGVLALAAVALAGAAALPALVFGYALGQGLGQGVTSILRATVTREVMGEVGYGESAGAVARISLFSFALAPGFGAVLVDLAGYGAVIALGIMAPLLGAFSLTRLRLHP